MEHLIKVEAAARKPFRDGSVMTNIEMNQEIVSVEEEVQYNDTTIA